VYKLIAIDIDDTLLTDDLKVTSGTRQAMDEAIRRGVVITLATGRMYASAQQVAKQIDLNVPLITYQGSLVKNLLDGQILYERRVPADAALTIYEFCNENGLHLQLYVNDVLYVREDNDKVRDYARLSAIPYTVDPDFDRLIHEPQTKMLIIDDPEKIRRLTPILRERLGDQVHITTSKPHYLEFLHKEGTKGDALRYLAGYYGCEMSEVIAIGDAWNDREMLEAAGLGVAMGNAADELKRLADYVTRTNNEEGVRHVIETFVLR
jgi:hypothetical protein